MSCKSADSPESVSSPNEETPARPTPVESSPATPTSTCRDVPNEAGTGVVSQCSFCRGCILEGNRNELIREVNIRLAGFGGMVPSNQFTAQTTRVIKQFQRDYMRLPQSGQTGFLCKSVLEAIDHFNSNYAVTLFNGMRCSCVSNPARANRCTGFGSARTGNSTYRPTQAGVIEHPGMHRSILAYYRAFRYYSEVIEANLGYRINNISSAYRCISDNVAHNRSTRNHQGVALDVQFSYRSINRQGREVFRDIRGSDTQAKKNENGPIMNAIRTSICIAYLGATYNRTETTPRFIQTVQLLLQSIKMQTIFVIRQKL